MIELIEKKEQESVNLMYKKGAADGIQKTKTNESQGKR